MPKEKLIEQKLAEIFEYEARKHVTHVGFAIIAIYKDGKSVAKTAARPGYEQQLEDAIQYLYHTIDLPSSSVLSA